MAKDKPSQNTYTTELAKSILKDITKKLPR